MKGVQALWGVGSIYGSTLVTDIRRKNGGEVDYLMDGNGFKITKIFFDDMVEIEINLIMKTGTVVPDRGDTVTVTGAGGAITGTLMCDDTEIAWTQKGWQKLKIAATAHANLT